MLKPLLLIKLGGSVITDKKTPYVANVDTIRKIAIVLKSIDQPMIIAHGSGSFGHTSASVYGGNHGYTSKIGIATVARDARAINSIVTSICIEEKLPAISLSPMSFLTSKDGAHSETFFSPLYLLLQQGLIPVVYGDVIVDQTWNTTIFSGETVLSHIALFLQKKNKYDLKILELCDVPGVLDQSNNVIAQITEASWQSVKSQSIRHTTNDVTGGMQHKVEEALILARKNIPTHIIDGRDPQIVKEVLEKNSQHGTLIHL